MGSARDPKIIMEWNAEGRRTEGKSSEQLMDGVRKSVISKDLTKEDIYIYICIVKSMF